MKKIVLILVLALPSLCLYAQVADSANFNKGEKIFTSPVQVMPQLRGGMQKFYYELENIRYDFYDRFKNIQGRVLVAMVIEKDGTISNVRMITGLTHEQDKEVLRAVRRLNKWKPGIQDGSPVRVQYTIPIDFKIIKS